MGQADITNNGIGEVYVGSVSRGATVDSSGIGNVQISAASDSVQITGSSSGMGKVQYNQGDCSITVSGRRERQRLQRVLQRGRGQAQRRRQAVQRRRVQRRAVRASLKDLRLEFERVREGPGEGGGRCGTTGRTAGSGSGDRQDSRPAHQFAQTLAPCGIMDRQAGQGRVSAKRVGSSFLMRAVTGTMTQ